ncbi:hypothetical protein QDX25_07025 [Auritidibacter ignavus]|uniref:Uncharacterized protein n=1 Tax=Auritidibacter ignavus TaxID=678932 RepID=A0AAJ6AHD6_9MICC|nr:MULTISPECIES: hypothetical protein [Auritidibacter]PXA81600.1 hypothetical protein DCC26_02290 [Auritidibacter sp. NML120779]PXA79897.1 hypothetical protein DCC25_07315 [Auritidibacter sp. NML120636]WGH80570.1 hypothetical protein QDX25_07025 [Auritidibacter ignavus]WGH86071.1 hypothetical protein QDX24_11015 [Auritidibacter ignavus]WGH88356.1 hypothetical protein QDX22_11015 [Auritidibacter ignavus]
MMLVYDLNRDRFDPVPAEASAEGRVNADQVVLAESFRVRHGAAPDLRRHRDRFLDGWYRLSAQPETAGLVPCLSGGTAPIEHIWWRGIQTLSEHVTDRPNPTTERPDLFPRIAVEIPDRSARDAPTPKVTLSLRVAAPFRQITRLWIPATPDPRRYPMVKGPDLARLATFTQDSRATAIREADVDIDDVVLHDGRAVCEAGSAALAMVDDDQLVFFSGEARLPSTSLAWLQQACAETGGTFGAMRITAGTVLLDDFLRRVTDPQAGGAIYFNAHRGPSAVILAGAENTVPNVGRTSVSQDLLEWVERLRLRWLDSFRPVEQQWRQGLTEVAPG